MSLFGLSGILICVTSVVFAGLVFIHDRKSVLNRIWAIFVLSVAVWGFGSYEITRVANSDDALLLWRFTHVGVIFIPVFFTHFVYIFLEIQSRRAVYISYLFGLFYLIMNTTPHFIGEMHRVFNEFYFVGNPSWLYTSFVAFFFGSVFYAHYLLYMKYRTVSETKQQQILYFFLGSAIGFSGGSTSFLPSYGVNLYPILNFSVVLYPIIMAYAILKHRLFNIRTVTTELLVAGISVALFIEIFFSATLTEIVLRSVLFLLVAGLGVFTVKSAIDEVRHREAFQELALKLESANRELKKLDAAKSEFISLASHQLRTPLTIVKGYISMILEKSFGTVSAKVSEVLAKIAEVNQELIEIVDTLLDLSRIEAGRIEYQFKNADVGETVRSVIEELSNKAAEKGLEIRLEARDEIPKFLFDKDKIAQAIFNLLDNAIKYSFEGVITVRLSRVVEDGVDFARLEVADRGIGISAKDMQLMFTKFARTEEARRLDTKGNGVGLYFVKRVVEDHGGRVGVESEGTGKGSTFFIELPLNKNPNEKI